MSLLWPSSVGLEATSSLLGWGNLFPGLERVVQFVVEGTVDNFE